MIADPDRIATMAAKARTKVMEEFDVENSAKRLLSIYRSLSPIDCAADVSDSPGET